MIIQELGKGKYSDCFKVSSGTHALALKLSYYRESTIRAYVRHSQHGDMNAAQQAKDHDAISVSMAMSEVGKQMRRHRVSPHIVRVFCEADIRHLPIRLRPMLSHRLPILSPQQTKHAHVCLMELFACNMTSFAKSAYATDATLRCVLFQVIYTLACLQKLFPGFRHNDLSTNNILIRRRRPPTPTRYAFGNIAFEISCPFMAAISDFDFTHVSGHGLLSNERVLSGKYRIIADHNPSYDIHFLLKTLVPLLGSHAQQAQRTIKFIHSLSLDPSRERSCAVRPHLVPATLLLHEYFAPLRRADGGAVSYAMPE